MMEKHAASPYLYEKLKARVLSGAHLPGERLDAPALSMEFGASLTPIRAALYRLVGDRLIETHPNNGFHMPRVTEPALRDLYDWNETILVQAVRRCRSAATEIPVESIDDEGEGLVSRTERLFERIVGLSGNGEFRHALDQTNARLHPIRRRKAGLLPNTDEELATLEDALSRQSFRQLEKALASYHRRRQAIVPEIVRRMHEPPPSSIAAW